MRFDLTKTLKEEVDSHPVLNNKWLISRIENLTLKDLKLWLSQEYFVSIDFVTWFLKASTITNDFDIRIVLIENIWEELGEGKKENSHVEILKNFMKDINFNFDDLNCSPKTTEYLKLMEKITEKNIYMALGALGPANEYLLKKEYGKMYNSYQALKIKENLPYGKFFEVNLNADEGHSKKIFDLIENVCNTDEKIKWVIEGNRQALSARNVFYEGLQWLE
jgi:pyrroloquinoline quinone (PQQ) biosynthesis protein C